MLPKLYNFLTRRIEDFRPLDEVVELYTCGPTVYDFVHIGNWRTFIFEDILKRVLEFNGYKVKHVMNITDIDDKTIDRAREQGIPTKDLAAKYEKAFFDDLQKLNIVRADFYPRATEHIDLMIKLIAMLLEKGLAYKAEDGVYFSVEKFKGYGGLSGLSKRNLKKGARIDSDQYDKESWADFALWKRSKKDEVEFDAPFGKGRPGWHIECSAMSMKYLGDPSASHSTVSSDRTGSGQGLNLENFKTIDIHSGGVDLLFPHHENEIAQSEGATGKKFVNFWVEGEHLLVEGQKMAKSLGNIFTLADIIKRGFEPLTLRYLFLTAHYRSKLNFTWKSLEAAENALSNLRQLLSTWDDPKVGRSDSESLQTRMSCAEFEGNFKGSLNSDLDVPKAMSVMWEMIKSDYPTSAKHQSVLVMDSVLGLGLEKIEKARLPMGAQKLIDKREELRTAGNFKDADKLREELKSMGVKVEDTEEGPKWKVRVKKKND